MGPNSPGGTLRAGPFPIGKSSMGTPGSLIPKGKKSFILARGEKMAGTLGLKPKKGHLDPRHPFD